MSKSSGHGFGRRSSGTVTVIETKVHRSSARKAKVAFYITTLVVGLLTMTVASDRMHPILAMLLGAAVGVATGALVWALVRIWPVIRLIWWWTPEILLALAVVYGWIALARHTVLPVRLVAVTVLVAVPAGWPWLRQRIVAVAWCAIVRHRLRTCFAQFIVANQSGSLPLIFWSRPTPVGERVWVQLRPGLSLSRLESRLDEIAVACWADRVVIERASGRNAGLLRVDVKRREVLTAKVGSPLPGLIDPNTDTTVLRPVDDVPTALDLPDVPDTTRSGGKPDKPARDDTPSSRRPVVVPVTPPVAVSSATTGEDVTDWI